MSIAPSVNITEIDLPGLLIPSIRSGHTSAWHGHGAAFGRADGNPLVVKVDQRLRYVKLTLSEKNFLHLDEVQVIQYR